MDESDVDFRQTIAISAEKLEGDLIIPPAARAIVLFAHGSGSSRYSLRNQYVAHILNNAGFATLLVDLLTQQEKEIDDKSRHIRFNIDLLAKRLLAVTHWLLQNTNTHNLQIGYFGSSTGAAAALIAAASLGDMVKAIVSRGGRPDLAGTKGVMQHVRASTLLIVGGNDSSVITLNKSSLAQLGTGAKELAVIPGAGHLFEEPGKMEVVAEIATEWFKCYLENGRKFENKYRHKPGLSSVFTKPHIRIRFKDRAAAGEMLASVLNKYEGKADGIVIGIPRGGVVVADAIAGKLGFELDIAFPRKLRSPGNSENSVGAIMQDGSVYIDGGLVESMMISKEYLNMEQSEQQKEIQRRMILYRPGQREYRIRGRIVVLVDDGAATGATVAAAARWIRQQEPAKIIVALPVASKQAMKMLKSEADDVRVLKQPSDFKALAQFYQNFQDVTDNQVMQIMKKHSLPA
jgi:predicted phosphoribosyltransferase/dienelactone hydrolase